MCRGVDLARRTGSTSGCLVTSQAPNYNTYDTAPGNILTSQPVVGDPYINRTFQAPSHCDYTFGTSANSSITALLVDTRPVEVLRPETMLSASKHSPTCFGELMLNSYPASS